MPGGADSAMKRVAEALVLNGRQIAVEGAEHGGGGGFPLLWRCFGKLYLGAAHGVVGVLLPLLRAWRLLSPHSQRSVRQTLNALLRVRSPATANLPIVLSRAPLRDEHVHWCHGAPGLVAMLAAAAHVLGDDGGALAAAAAAAAEVV